MNAVRLLTVVVLLAPLVSASTYLENFVTGQPEAALDAAVTAMEELIASITSDVSATENAICSDAAWVDMCTEVAQLDRNIEPTFSNDTAVDLDKVSIKTPLNFDQDVEPDDVNGLEVCASLRLINTYQSNLANLNPDDHLKWQYYGGQNSAIWSVYPGYEWESPDSTDCDPEWDPRFRPWYASGASGPKDVVIIIDRSGSMSQNNRMDLAREAAKAVLLTLTHNDFYRVITFSDDAQVVSNGFSGADDGLLRRGTIANLEEDSDLIDAVFESGSTNMAAAYSLAFDLLETSRQSGRNSSSLCHSAILFLTDGDNTGEDPLNVISTRNTNDIDARIFTYTLGSDASRSLPKDMACDNRGIYTHVDDDDYAGLRTAMASYYSYFAAGLDSTQVAWSEIYEFVAGGPGVSGSRPVYKYDEDGQRELFGVIAIDYFQNALTAGGDSPDEVNQFLRERSEMCLELDLTDDRIEALRPVKCSNTVAWIVGGVIAGVLLLICAIAGCRRMAVARAERKDREERQKKAEAARQARQAQIAASYPPPAYYGPPGGGPPGGYQPTPPGGYQPQPPPGGYQPQPPGYTMDIPPGAVYDPNANSPRYQ